MMRCQFTGDLCRNTVMLMNPETSLWKSDHALLGWYTLKELYLK